MKVAGIHKGWQSNFIKLYANVERRSSLKIMIKFSWLLTMFLWFLQARPSFNKQRARSLIVKNPDCAKRYFFSMWIMLRCFEYKHQEFQTSGACAMHYRIASQKKWAPILEWLPCWIRRLLQFALFFISSPCFGTDIKVSKRVKRYFDQKCIFYWIDETEISKI